MKTYFEEPKLEMIPFSSEDILNVSDLVGEEDEEDRLPIA